MVPVTTLRRTTTGPRCSGGAGCGDSSHATCYCSRTRSLSLSCRSCFSSSGQTLTRAATSLWPAPSVSFRSLRPRKLHSSAIAGRDVHHLLHLFYLSVGLPEEAVSATDNDPRRHAAPPSELPQWIPSARELEEAGVKFRARKDAKSFLDVRFHGGILEIPELELYDYSEPLLRNLIAFEQTYPFTPGHVTAYAIFMDCLVTSPEDMRLLHLSGVLVNQMNGERDAAGFFGRLCAEAHLAADQNYLARVILEINRYQRSRWPRWRAALVRNYFSNPWVVMSLFAAIFLLALTVMQSFFAAYSYFKPPKQQQ
uniref:Uncharacterized protein n=1 Tax=Avena sativa TaxID=4498 RepID=A0ACD5TBY5_AVESA